MSAWRLLLVLVLSLAMGCPAHKTASSGSDDWDEEEEEEEEEEEKDVREREPDHERESGSTSVRLGYRKLPDAIVENGPGTQPIRDVEKLRRILCTGQESEAIIFYQIIASAHWHYFWICSDTRPHRKMSRVGSARLKKWLAGFKRQAQMRSRDCSAGSEEKLLKGTHESGIRATASCNGRIDLQFPDGVPKTLYFTSQVGDASSYTPAAEEPTREIPITGTNCPPCPACSRGQVQNCRDCPPPTPCPPPRQCPPPQQCAACPPPTPCPACDCRSKEIAAGRNGFTQGVKKACQKICAQIYKKCRSLNPNTSLCYQTSEYCANECGK